MVATRPGDDPTPRAGEGGPRRTTAQLASDPAFTGTYAQVVALAGAGIDATGAGDSTTALNALLASAAGKYVKGVPGSTYAVSAPLSVPSGTTLDMTGCTVALKNNTGSTLLKNSDYAGGNSDVTIIGGTWDGLYGRGANYNGVSDQNQQHAMDFRNVTRLTIRSTRHIDATKYAIRIANARQVTVRDVYFSTHSDGLHMHGPIAGADIRNLSGSTGDDFLAIGNSDFAAYDPGSTGDCTDILIDGLYPTACTGNIVHPFTSTGFVISDLAIRNLYGAKTGASNFIVSLDASAANGGTMRRVLVENIQTSTTSNAPLVRTYNADDVTIRDVRMRSNPGNTDMIRVESASTVARLVIDGVTDMQARATSGLVKINGTVTDLIVSRVQASLAAAGRLFSLTGAVTRASLSDVQATGVKSGDYGVLIGTSASGVLLKMANWQLNNIEYPIWCQTTAEVDFLGVDFTACTATVFLDGASAAPTVKGAGIKSAPTFRSVQSNSTGTLRSKSIDFPQDLVRTEIAKNAGDLVYNTNASAAPFTVGPAVCDGTQWRSLTAAAVKTGTATLVAGTVTVADTSITNNSVIRLAYKTIGGTPGAAYVSARTAGTSFAITSTSGADTSVVQYYIDAY